MASLSFTYSATTKTLNLVRCKIPRRSVRAKYNAHNGNFSSNYRATQLRFILKWEHVTTTEYADIVWLLDHIRQGHAVKLTAVSGLSYFDDSCLGTGIEVDLESDEVLEQDFEFFEKMPVEFVLISKSAMGLTHST